MSIADLHRLAETLAGNHEHLQEAPGKKMGNARIRQALKSKDPDERKKATAEARKRIAAKKMGGPGVGKGAEKEKKNPFGGKKAPPFGKKVQEAERLQEYNPYHDKGGRFTSKGKSKTTVSFSGRGKSGMSRGQKQAAVKRASNAGGRRNVRLTQDRRASGRTRGGKAGTGRGKAGGASLGQLRKMATSKDGRSRRAARAEIKKRAAAQKFKSKVSGGRKAAAAKRGSDRRRSDVRAKGRAAANKHSAKLAAKKFGGRTVAKTNRSKNPAFKSTSNATLGKLLKSGSTSAKKAARREVRRRAKSYKSAKAGRASGKARGKR